MGSDIRLTGKLALVTGAAGGIGFEFAKVLAGVGAALILIDLSEERLREAEKTLKDLYGNVCGEIYLLKADLTDRDIVDKVDEYCNENTLNPDILINNAGIFSFKEIAETSEAKINTFVDLHVRAVTLLSRWFVEKRRLARDGWMLNMSSMSCWMPMPGLAMYAATKSYIRVFTRSLHYEAKDYGIGVTVACPGGIATDLFGLPEKWKRFAVAIGVLDTPEGFARKAVKRMLKRKKQYINGWLNRLSIFFVGVTPTCVRMMVKHKLLDRGITR